MRSGGKKAIRIEKRSCSIGLSVFLISIFSAISSPVMAGSFSMLKGEGVEVCTSYKKYLDSAGAPEDFVPKQKNRLSALAKSPRSLRNSPSRYGRSWFRWNS